MIKKTKLIIIGSTVLAGSTITGIAVPLSQKANQPTPEQKQEQEKIPALTKEKQQNPVESGSGEKTKENSGQVEVPKDSAEEKQKDGAESGSGGKIEENNKAAESMESQANSQKDSNTQKQQDKVESPSGGKVEETKSIEISVEKQRDEYNAKKVAYYETYRESLKQLGQDNVELKTIDDKISSTSTIEDLEKATNDITKLIKKKETELNSKFTNVADIVEKNFPSKKTELIEIKSELGQDPSVAKLTTANKKLKDFWDKLRIEEGKKEENKITVEKLELKTEKNKHADFNFIFKGSNMNSRFNNNQSARVLIKSKKNGGIVYFDLNIVYYKKHNIYAYDDKIDFSTDLNGPNKANFNKDFWIDEIIIESNKEIIDVPLDGKALVFNASKAIQKDQTIKLQTIEEINQQINSQ
ncbi:hypothetical protein [Mesomycoplasma bovoculi]|uniref:Uncharacterized protein n=1 Tax=Mesomycoplasma bovoculi M165/69 TaxID=743966 RepID=W5UTB2_9BACT|nr:hypothetical protein [Mesomycoplasma bovoculi]AHH45366.1 hypothetical protein MYB_01785 [Mesomycoplasma bovoculi M165/69]